MYMYTCCILLFPNVALMYYSSSTCTVYVHVPYDLVANSKECVSDIHVHIHVHVHVHLNIHVHVFCDLVGTWIYMYMYMYTPIYMYIHIVKCTCMLINNYLSYQ